jgi:hypothetical protein
MEFELKEVPVTGMPRPRPTRMTILTMPGADPLDDIDIFTVLRSAPRDGR